jgi:phosphopantetheinyl transferase
MPLFYQHNINENTKLGIWQIKEPEVFFLEKVPLKKDVSHPHKRLQHLAGRYLLPTLFNDFPLEEILIADTRKPFLPNERYHFSISHCGDFAAAIVSSRSRVGIDVEIVTKRIQPVSEKFLNNEEKRFLTTDDKLFLKQWGLSDKMHTEFLTLMWSAKECIFKWYGLGKLDFRQHMQLEDEIIFREDEWMALPFLFTKGRSISLTVEAKIFDNLVLAWVLKDL